MSDPRARWLSSLAALAMLAASASGQEATWEAAHKAGWTALNAGRYDEAEAQFRTAEGLSRAFGPRDSRRATSYDDLAFLFAKRGRYADAESMAKSAIGLWEKSKAEAGPNLAWSLSNLASV